MDVLRWVEEKGGGRANGEEVCPWSRLRTGDGVAIRERGRGPIGRLMGRGGLPLTLLRIDEEGAGNPSSSSL